MIDLRSDTVTKPTPAMRRVMAEAEVGDDVYGEDPTVLRLEASMADQLGKEAALFVPSGTMANQIAIRVQTRPGDEIILEESGHSFLYESGALGGVSHVQAHPLRGTSGLLSAEAIAAAVRPKPDHYARTSLVVIENTSNGGGGTIYSPDHIEEIGRVAKERGLALHLDGARLWNAHVATGRPLDAFTRSADSVSACFSKGLGAPIGSILAGTKAFIVEAHRHRKMLGGGMRQVGILAAAALYAVEHHLARIAEDHESLALLTLGLSRIQGLDVDPARFPTNIAYVGLSIDSTRFVTELRAQGVLVNPTGPRTIRVVTHLDVDRSSIERAIDAFARCLR